MGKKYFENITEFREDLLKTLHGAIRNALKKEEYEDFRECADELEVEMKRRGISF
ncbi:MAG: hypothetical protein WA162_07450 [Thermodesulfobacteriota bacterium]